MEIGGRLAPAPPGELSGAVRVARDRTARHPALRAALALITAALGSGVLLAASLPPWGWWPLALLGAAGLEDIGHYFPDTEEKFKDADSIDLLREVRRVVGDAWEVANIDAVVICERPKIRDHRDEMRRNLAGALEIDVSQVSVRGTTTERLGFAGRGEGIAAQAVCLLQER